MSFLICEKLLIFLSLNVSYFYNLCRLLDYMFLLLKVRVLSTAYSSPTITTITLSQLLPSIFKYKILYWECIIFRSTLTSRKPLGIASFKCCILLDSSTSEYPRIVHAVQRIQSFFHKQWPMQMGDFHLARSHKSSKKLFHILTCECSHMASACIALTLIHLHGNI